MKIFKEKAEYVYFSKTERCKDCSMFIKPESCSLVRGEIELNGHCKYFEAANKLPVEK